MNIHFLYRYWSIKTTDRVPLFANKVVVLVLIAVGAARGDSILALIFFPFLAGLMTLMGGVRVTDEFSRRYAQQYGRTNEGAWVTMAYKTDDGSWNHLTILLMAIFDGLAVGQCCLAISLSSLPLHPLCTGHFGHVQGAPAHVVDGAVLAAPVICVYIPYLGLLSSPILALDLGAFPDLFPVLIASFPAWDALVVMLVIKDFREGLLSACRLFKQRVGDTKESHNHIDK